MMLVMQFLENLSDRQAASSVQGRIDWKYALSLELTDPGFDFSVLSEFRERLIAGGVEQQILDLMLLRFQERKLLWARGKQRTDSTHVLTVVRDLTKLEHLGETLRYALNAVAEVAPTCQLRNEKDGPSSALRIRSPYDKDARNSTKRTTNWTLYKVHLTESCDENSPHIITHVETTAATTQDLTVVPSIHQALGEKNSCLNSTWLTKHTHQHNCFLAQSETITLTCWDQ